MFYKCTEQAVYNSSFWRRKLNGRDGDGCRSWEGEFKFFLCIILHCSFWFLNNDLVLTL